MARPQDKDVAQPSAPPRGLDERPKDAEGDPEFLSADSDCEDEVDLSSEDSFPASDPPSHTPLRTGVPRPKAADKAK